MFKDYYKILEISNKASKLEIKSAYRAMSLKWHPDKNPNTDVTSIMQDINEAYKLLKDEDKRKRYDEEYSQFIKQTHQTTYSYASNVNTNTSENSQKYEYDYEVQDETLREDIKAARKYAQELVDEFIKSFKTASKDAAKGAWKGAKPYIYAAILFIIIGLVIKMCSSATYDNNQQFSDSNITNYDDLTESITKEVQIEKVLSSFKAPDSWTQYTINHNAFSLSVPSTVELRHEYDQYTQLLKKIGLVCNTDIIVFQQKGLSNTIIGIDKHYCRIMIRHIKGEASDFLAFNETKKIDFETKSFLRELVIRELGPTFKLLGEPSYDWIDINGQKAIEIKYRRSGNNDNTTACTLYLLFNYNEMVKMIISYREQEKDLWLPDVNNVIKTFKWL